mgnify:CR=1 FL=1
MAEYTFDVQKLYLEMLLADAESFARASNIFTPKSFDRKLQPIAKFIKNYVEEYKVMPEVDQVNAKHDIKLKGAKDLDPSHFSWLLDEFETFSRHKALESAILQSADLLEKGDYAPVEDMIKEAVSVGLTRDLGTDYFDDPKSRLEFLKNSHGQVSTGWPAIDKKLFGGFNRGELNIFAGGSGAGKSLFLQNLALNWALAGLNVAYISFELSEALAAMRIDAMTTNIPTRQVMKQMSDVEIKVKMLKKKAGNLQLKYMPSGYTIMDIKTYIKELELKNKDTVWKGKYFYNSKGQLTQIKRKNRDKYFNEIFEYKQNGDLIKKASETNKNRITENTSFSADNYSTKYKYNQNNKLIRETTFNHKREKYRTFYYQIERKKY